MSKLLRIVQDCHNEAERKACSRMEQSMARLLNAAQKRRDALETKMGTNALNSPAYLVAAHEYMILQHWKSWITRNCDYRRMQVKDNL